MLALVTTSAGVTAVDEAGAARVELAGDVSALRADGTRGCWAIVDRRSIARRDDDGTWSAWPLAVDAPLTAVLPRGDGALVGTGDARLWRVLDAVAAPVEGFDAVAGRDTWHAVGSRTPYVRSISATGGDGALLVSVHVGGIPRSTNGGGTWNPTVDVDDDVHEVRAHPADPSIVMAAAAVGLLESRDGGATWAEPTTTGLHATYLRAVAFPTGAVLVSASDGPFGRRPALYRRALDGGRFERCTTGLPDWLPTIVDTAALDARGDDVVAGAADTVFASHDGGATWRVLAAGLPEVRAVAIR